MPTTSLVFVLELDLSDVATERFFEDPVTNDVAWLLFVTVAGGLPLVINENAHLLVIVELILLVNTSALDLAVPDSIAVLNVVMSLIAGLLLFVDILVKKWVFNFSIFLIAFSFDFS